MEKELTLDAKVESIATLTSFVEECLASCGGSAKAISQISIALDEIVSNIVNYSGAQNFTVKISVEENSLTASVAFIDCGVPYNPLKKEDPDTTLSAENREIGGLGIFLVKKIMDDVCYSREGEKNILVLKKHL